MKLSAPSQLCGIAFIAQDAPEIIGKGNLVTDYRFRMQHIELFSAYIAGMIY